MSARAGRETRRAPWTLVAAVTIAALAASALAGLALGRWAGERASQPTVIEVLIEDPALAAPDAAGAGRRRAASRASAASPRCRAASGARPASSSPSPGRLVIASDGATTAIDYRAPSRLFEIAPVEGVEPGDVVVVRLVGGAVTAMLIVPPDVEEGSGAGAR